MMREIESEPVVSLRWRGGSLPLVYWRPTRARARVLHPTKGIGARAAPAVVRTGPRAAQAWQLNGAAGGRRHERHEGGGAAHVPAERGEHAAAKGARCGVRQRRVFGGSGAAQRQHCPCIVLRDCTTRLTCLAPPSPLDTTPPRGEMDVAPGCRAGAGTHRGGVRCHVQVGARGTAAFVRVARRTARAAGHGRAG